ncbi:MAG: VWA domain-containing protein [Candidatus Ancaeobacter aquaticus]|nr:VWA domain-containing protein [Candidatus Ancaeobacter aquaticus]
MQFGKLEYIQLLWVVVAVAFFLYYAFRKKQVALEKFSEHTLLKNLVANVSFKKQKIRACIVIAALSFVVLALIDPKWGYHWEDVKRKGVDIVIVLDTSKSMLAKDMKPNRLKVAKRGIEDFVNVLRGDRVSLVTFAGTSFIQCPLTTDYAAFKMFLDDVTVESVPRGGTNIGGAIITALKAFPNKTDDNKIIILITDGEDHSGTMIKAAREAKKKGAVIYAVGIGNPIGAPIPVMNARGVETYKKDSQGNVILTKVDEEGLKQVAFETGGAYLSASAGSIGLERIYEQKIAKLEKKEFNKSRKRVFKSRFQIPLAIAFILLLFEVVIGDKKKIRKT